MAALRSDKRQNAGQERSRQETAGLRQAFRYKVPRLRRLQGATDPSRRLVEVVIRERAADLQMRCVRRKPYISGTTDAVMPQLLKADMGRSGRLTTAHLTADGSMMGDEILSRSHQRVESVYIYGSDCL